MPFTSNFVDEETLSPTLSHYSRFWWLGSDPGRDLDVTTNTLTSKENWWTISLHVSLMVYQIPGVSMWSGWWPGDPGHPQAGQAHQEGAPAGEEVDESFKQNLNLNLRSSLSWSSTVPVSSWIWIWSTSMHPLWQWYSGNAMKSPSAQWHLKRISREARNLKCCSRISRVLSFEIFMWMKR